MKPKTLVVMGGTSREKDVSLRSGENIYQALKKKGFEAERFVFDGTNTARFLERDFDIAFSLIHGGEGEDGRLAAFFEMNGIRYVGSSPEAQSVTMAKHLCQPVIGEFGMRIPEHETFFTNSEAKERLPQFFSRFRKAVVKPSREGSSVGIRICSDEHKAVETVSELLNEYTPVVVERFVEGTEITCGIIEMNGSVKVFTLMEIRAKNEFYDYHAKYTSGMTDFVVPASIEGKSAKEIKAQAETLFRKFGLRDFARLDCILGKEGIYWHDINTVPGMTELSDLPQVAAYDGMRFPDLAEAILLNAYERYEK